MNIYAAQQSIVSQLQQTFSQLQLSVTALDLPDTTDIPSNVTDTTVYVRYTGSNAYPFATKNDVERYDVLRYWLSRWHSTTTDVVAQARYLCFQIEILSPSLYDANGIFATRSAVDAALTGFAPANCNRLFLLKDEVSKAQNSGWQHVVTFECETMLIQQEENEDILVPKFGGIQENDIQ